MEESTGRSDALHEAEFNAWSDSIERLDDISASREILNHILHKSDLDQQSKDLLKTSYDYCIRLIQEGKPLDPYLMKIHLQDIKGYDISQVNLVNLIMMLGCCGIIFSERPK